MTTPGTTRRPTTATPGSVVVGVDGSVSSDRAVEWAVRQAALEHRPLALVHAARIGPAGHSLRVDDRTASMGMVLDDLLAAGLELLTATADHVRSRSPEVEVQEVLSTDDPREVLLECSRTAALTVLGSRGRGPVSSLLLGSVSLAVSRHSVGPVVVVRGTTPDPARLGLLVEVDGTADSVPAVELAYHLASFRGLPLTALHVFWDADHHDGRRTVGAGEQGLGDERALLAEAVAGMQEKYPDVDDDLVLRRGFRDRELLRAAEDASLVVVGANRAARFPDYLHATVAAAVVEHVACDVVVVPSGSR